VFLDNDLNAFNGSVAEVYRETLGSTGTNSIYPGTIQWVSNPTNTAPGTYATYARISAGGHTRYLYAPEILTLKPSLAAPFLTSFAEKNGDAQFTIQRIYRSEDHIAGVHESGDLEFHRNEHASW